jgi:Right handed beta helix region
MFIMRLQLLGAAALAVLVTASAGAAQRTFVASTGNDLNACTLIAPCRGFPAAISQTDPNGEIIVLDSAGYGAATVDRSLSIVAAPGVYAGISVFSSFNGITVDAPGARVVLRGLSINGQGGNIGVWMLHGAELHVENCVIAGLTTGLRAEAGSTVINDTVVRSNAQNGIVVDTGAAAVHLDRVQIRNNGNVGIRLDQAAANLRASIRDSVITDNGNAGIVITTDQGALNAVDIDSTEVTSNGWSTSSVGILIFANEASAKAQVSIAKCLVARNLNSGILATAATGIVHVSVTDSTITGNYAQGIEGSGVTIIASRNTITRNLMNGMQNTAGAFFSYGDNRVQGNFGGATLGPISPLGGM